MRHHSQSAAGVGCVDEVVYFSIQRHKLMPTKKMSCKQMGFLTLTLSDPSSNRISA